MKLIVAEKAIAGRRIAQLLAENPVEEKIEAGAQLFYFKRENEEYMVIPLRGHIMNVEFPKNYSAWLGTDLSRLALAPVEYVETEKKILDLLRKKASKCSEVIIATDSDREGESIGWEALQPVLLSNKKIKVSRATFSAIIKEDIEEAFSNISQMDNNLAFSANARREIDLIWGAVLTRFLSLVSGRLGSQFLSAGRVQSPTLALIVAREKERDAFKSDPYWEIEALFESDSVKFKGFHENGKFFDKREADKVIEKETDVCVVKKIKKTKRTLKKPEPFNTTSYLRAATALGYSAGRAMSIAETLYQKGLTSYPRTDNAVYPKNLNLKKILQMLSNIDFLRSDAQKILSLKKLEPSKGKSSRDHPPIHPVSILPKGIPEQEKKIYELIARRFLATLAQDAITKNLTINIAMKDEMFIASGQTFIEKGWKDVYPYSKASEVFLPELETGQKVKLKKLSLLSKETQPKPHYSQGSLIKLMADNNLGTKSTRHSIIQKLYARKYISGNKSITAGKVAYAVINALEKYDGQVVKPKMTSELEKEMDMIASGKKSKDEIVDGSREMLFSVLKDLIENKDKIGSTIRGALREDMILASCTRENCEGQLIIRRGYSGKRFLGCTTYPKCNETYPLPQKGTVNQLDKVCEVCGKPMLKIIGKRYSFEMCVDMSCNKKRWGDKKEKKEKEKKESAKKAPKEKKKKEEAQK